MAQVTSSVNVYAALTAANGERTVDPLRKAPEESVSMMTAARLIDTRHSLMRLSRARVFPFPSQGLYNRLSNLIR